MNFAANLRGRLRRDTNYSADPSTPTIWSRLDQAVAVKYVRLDPLFQPFVFPMTVGITTFCEWRNRARLAH